MAQRGGPGASVLAPTLTPPPSFADVKGGASSTAPSVKLVPYTITMPDGTIYDVDAPETTPEEEIKAQVAVEHQGHVQRQQQLNYPTQTELGKEPGRATGSTGILDSIGQGLSSGWEDIKSLPASILGLNDPDSLTGVIARGLSGKGPRDLKAELVAAQEQSRAQAAKQGAEAGLDKTSPYTINPNTLHTAVNVAGALPGITPITPILPVQGSLPIAPIANKAIETSIADAGTEAAMAVLGPILGVKAGIAAAGPISRGLTALGEESGIPIGKLQAKYNPPTNLASKPITAMSNMIKSGVHNPVTTTSLMLDSGVKPALVNDVAAAVQPLWQQAATEVGAREFPARAFTPAGRENVLLGVKKALSVADRAVEIADRPFDEVLKKWGNVSIEPVGRPPDMTVKGRILAGLDHEISTSANNPALANSLKVLRGEVEYASTFNDLQSLKKLANKKTTALFDAAPGRAIDMTADAAYSWRVLADTIRAEMYPDLRSISGVDLSQAGRLEGMVMDGRDGLYQHVHNDVMNPHNALAQQNYFRYVFDGSQGRRQILRRALMLPSMGFTPAAEFNARFSKVIGDVPDYYEFHVPFGTGGPARPNITTAGQQANMFQGGGLGYADVQGQPNVIGHGPLFSQPVSSGPPVAAPMPPPPSLTPEMLAEVHRQQLARQAGVEGIAFPYPPRSAPFSQAPTLPPTQTGAPAIPAAQTPPAFGSTAVRDASVRASLGLPAEPVHPRIARPVTETHGVGGSEPYLYGEQPTRPYMDPNSGTPIRFNPIQRDTYTTQDLMGMMMEINSFIRDFPSHPEVAVLKQDLAAVQHEITRRMEARRVGPRL